MKAFWLCELSCDATFIVKFPRFVFSRNRLETFPRLLLLLNLMLRTARHWSVAMQKKNFAVKSKSISTCNLNLPFYLCLFLLINEWRLLTVDYSRWTQRERGRIEGERANIGWSKVAQWAAKRSCHSKCKTSLTFPLSKPSQHNAVL